MTGKELVSIIVQNGLLDKQIESGTELVFNICMKEGANSDEGNIYVDYVVDCDTGHIYDIEDREQITECCRTLTEDELSSFEEDPFELDILRGICTMKCISCQLVAKLYGQSLTCMAAQIEESEVKE